MIDTAVDSITGDEPVRFGRSKFLIKAGKNTGTTTGMIGFAEVRNRFTVSAMVNDPRWIGRVLFSQFSGNGAHVSPRPCNAISQKKESLGFFSLHFGLFNSPQHRPSAT
jgi:hypothetical protein